MSPMNLTFGRPRVNPSHLTQVRIHFPFPNFLPSASPEQSPADLMSQTRCPRRNVPVVRMHFSSATFVVAIIEFTIPTTKRGVKTNLSRRKKILQPTAPGLDALYHCTKPSLGNYL